MSWRCSWLAVHVRVLISPTCLLCLFLYIHVCSGIVAMARFHGQPLLCGMCQHAHMLANSTLPYCPFIHLPLSVGHQTQKKNLFLLFGCCPWKRGNAPSLAHALWVFLFCLDSFMTRVFVCVHVCDASSFPCCTIPLVTGKRWDESQTDAQLIASIPKWKKKKNASGVNRLLFFLLAF